MICGNDIILSNFVPSLEIHILRGKRCIQYNLRIVLRNYFFSEIKHFCTISLSLICRQHKKAAYLIIPNGYCTYCILLHINAKINSL